MNLVTMRDVSVAYDGYEAIQHVDLEIGDNDFLGVIGPNGGGKTTLVKVILGTTPAPNIFRPYGARFRVWLSRVSSFRRRWDL